MSWEDLYNSTKKELVEVQAEQSELIRQNATLEAKLEMLADAIQGGNERVKEILFKNLVEEYGTK